MTAGGKRTLQVPTVRKEREKGKGKCKRGLKAPPQATLDCWKNPLSRLNPVTGDRLDALCTLHDEVTVNSGESKTHGSFKLMEKIEELFQTQDRVQIMDTVIDDPVAHAPGVQVVEKMTEIPQVRTEEQIMKMCCSATVMHFHLWRAPNPQIFRSSTLNLDDPCDSGG